MTVDGWPQSRTPLAARGAQRLEFAGQRLGITNPQSVLTRAVAMTIGVGATLSLAAAHATPKPPAAVRSRKTCDPRPLHLLCPDLVMSAPSQLLFDRSTLPGRVLLRATSSVDNHGRGPLELRATRRGHGRWRVYQAIYDTRGRAHLFRIAARLTYKFIPGTRYGLGNLGNASYWKLQHAAAFELWSINRHFKAIRRVRRGPKVDFCLRDLSRTMPSPASPPAPIYAGCRQSQRIRTDTLGTSVGWSDVYPFSYPEQWIDVTGLHGRFAYVQRADPDGLLFESSHHNDVSETYVQLPSGRILGRRVGVMNP